MKKKLQIFVRNFYKLQSINSSGLMTSYLSKLVDDLA